MSPVELCKAQLFTRKGSFIRLLYKLILVHSYSSHLNLGIEFHARTQKNFEVSVSQSKKLICLGLAEKNTLLAVSQSLCCAETETVAFHVALRLHSADLPTREGSRSTGTKTVIRHCCDKFVNKFVAVTDCSGLK